MIERSTAIYHHVDCDRVPEGGQLCEYAWFRDVDPAKSTAVFSLGIWGLELMVFYDPKHTNQLLDKLRVAVRECEEALDVAEEERKKVEDEPTNDDTIHDPPDMGMDDRSRED